MNLLQWIKTKFAQVLNSIAFIPAVVVLLSLMLSAVMIYFDYSDLGKELKSRIDWIRLKDPSTARSIVSVISAGLISITVFSFSMVMVVLNQAASQLSNRIIDKLIGNKLQQFVLGFYIGTILYSLFLLSSIRDIESGIYVPALSTYLLILMAVIAILLFVFFLHFITQSIKYSVIIHRVFNETKKRLTKTCQLKKEPEVVPLREGQPVPAPKSGAFESFNAEGLVKLLHDHECVISFRLAPGQFVLERVPLYYLSHEKTSFEGDLTKKINEHILIVDEESIQNNFYYGLRQLTEIAIKALSPGINDPGTAVESIRSLIQLLAYRLEHYQDNTIRDDKGQIRIITTEKTFEEILDSTLLPIWDYGHKDRLIQKEYRELLIQLQSLKENSAIQKLLVKVLEEIRKMNS